MQDTHISLAHGNGGRYMRELIEELFARHLSNPALDLQADAAKAAGVQVAAGDTKVLPRGEVGGIYLATTGIGTRPAGIDLGIPRIQNGDAILVSGSRVGVRRAAK